MLVFIQYSELIVNLFARGVEKNDQFLFKNGLKDHQRSSVQGIASKLRAALSNICAKLSISIIFGAMPLR